jgi:hypothetical protein
MEGTKQPVFHMDLCQRSVENHRNPDQIPLTSDRSRHRLHSLDATLSCHGDGRI